MARSLIAIGTSDADRRSRAIVLTDTGRALLSEARRLWVEAQHSFEEAFGANEALQLRILLKRVATLELGEAGARS